MESGLDGRNNLPRVPNSGRWTLVSMESGLDGRNNPIVGVDDKVYVELSQWSPA